MIRYGSSESPVAFVTATMRIKLPIAVFKHPRIPEKKHEDFRSFTKIAGNRIATGQGASTGMH